MRPNKIFKNLQDEISSVLDFDDDEKKRERATLYPKEYEIDEDEITPKFTKSRRDRITDLISQLTPQHFKQFLPFHLDFDPEEGKYIDFDNDTFFQIVRLLLPKVGWNTFLLDKYQTGYTFGPTNIFELYILGDQNWKKAKKKYGGGEIDVNISNGRESPIFYAIICENIPAIKYIISQNKNLINTVNNQNWTPLHFAAVEGSIYTIETLIELGADVNVRDNKGRTPLHLNALYNYQDPYKIFVFLRKSGADIYARDNEGRIPIHGRDEEGKTPLHKAAFSQNTEWIKFLIDSGVDINARDKTGETPLHRLFIKGRYGILKIFKLFIFSGADVDARDETGETPLELIFKYEDEDFIYEVLSILIQKELKDIESFLETHPNQKSKFQQQVLSKDFVCPITNQIMIRPYENSLKSVYEQQAIKGWHQTNIKNRVVKDPLKGRSYQDRTLYPSDKIVQIEKFLRNKLKQIARKQQQQSQSHRQTGLQK